MDAVHEIHLHNIGVTIQSCEENYKYDHACHCKLCTNLGKSGIRASNATKERVS